MVGRSDVDLEAVQDVAPGNLPAELREAVVRTTADRLLLVNNIEIVEPTSSAVFLGVRGPASRRIAVGIGWETGIRSAFEPDLMQRCASTRLFESQFSLLLPYAQC